jgi:hypothetical protein
MGEASELDLVCTWAERSNNDEFQQVLSLRRLAYKNAGMEVSEDDFDARCAVLSVRLRCSGDLIGSVRAQFQKSAEVTNEYDPPGHYPAALLPPRTSVVVASRICVHPTFLKHQLFYFILGELALESWRRGYTHIFGSARAALLAPYAKAGFHPVGEPTFHPYFKYTQQTLLASLDDMRSGKGVDQAIWKKYYAQLPLSKLRPNL